MDFEDPSSVMVANASGSGLSIDSTTSTNVAWVTFNSDRTKTSRGFSVDLVEKSAPGMQMKRIRCGAFLKKIQLSGIDDSSQCDSGWGGHLIVIKDGYDTCTENR